MARFTKIFALAAALFGFSPIHAQDFNPEKDIKATWRNGAVVLDVPSVAHASDIAVFLKPGSQGKISIGPLPPPSGADALGAPYWGGAIRIPVKGNGLKDPVVLMVSFMSCMEGEGGQCFPPVDKELRIKAKDIPNDPSLVLEVPAKEAAPTDAGQAEKIPPEVAPASPTAVAPANESGQSPAPSVSAVPDASTEKQSKKSDGLIKILILFFLGGIGASLTPCVLPMIPITMAVIGASSASKLKGLLLGLVLTEGMALTYTVLGVVAALTGSVFGQFAQQPGFLIPVSIIFAIFAISLFGAFEIKLPDSWTEKLQSSGPRKGFLGAFATGLILGPISAPCVGPLIGTAIVEIGQNGQVFEGALKMFVFAQGMGVLFIIGGTAVSALPKSGDWMTRFKQTLGVIVLAFAAWNIRLIVPEWANYFMWAIVMLLTAGVFGAFEAAAGLMGHVRKGFALLSLAIAVLLGVRATELYLDVPLLPRGGNVASDDSTVGHGVWIEHDYEAAQARAKAEGKIVLVDTFTDWCAQCKELDEKTWPDPAVVDWIKNNAVAVRIDTEKVRPDLAKPLGIAAYPTIILLTADGVEIRRLNGFHKPEKMLEWLKG